MARCRVCGRVDRYVSGFLGVCGRCVRERWGEASRYVLEAHRRSRLLFSLPPEPPRGGGVVCRICGNRCSLGTGERGYCGVIEGGGGYVLPVTGSWDVAVGFYYYDPHPTNCVADWVCPGATGRGYPRYALSPRGERGYYNIAVFYGSCNMDCLYCQNYEYRRMARDKKPLLAIRDLVEAVNERTTCVCFFGGDPGPQIIHALRAAREMRRRARELGLRVFRVCWETNGLVDKRVMREMARISLESGGIVKIDVKAYSPEIYMALTGSDGRLVYENLGIVAEMGAERRDPPLLVASTLLVPGYIDEYEIDGITRYIAGLDPETPYRLLAFHPDYLMRDLPPTPRRLAEKAVEIARRNGLRNVSVGNTWLLV